MININKKNDERGMALLYAIWSLAILSAIIISYVYYMTIELRLGYRYMDTVKARFIAEAAVARAIASIKGDWVNNDRASSTSVSDASCIGGIDYTGFYDWVGGYYGDGTGEDWSNLGVWDGTSATYRETFHLRDSQKYYMPSGSSSFTDGDIGYYIVAVEDESGKININNIAGADAAQKKTVIQNGSYDFTHTTATDNIVNTSPSGFYPTVQSAGRAGYVGFASTYTNRSHWTVYTDGKINVNSAKRQVLEGIPLSGGTTVGAGDASAIITARQTGAITDITALNAILSGENALEDWVRFNSNGMYRIVAMGAVVASDGSTEGEVRSMARIEAYVSRRNFYDPSPPDNWGMKILYWRELWRVN